MKLIHNLKQAIKSIKVDMFNNMINLAGLAALEQAEILENRPRRRRIQQLRNPFEEFSEIEFMRHYRLTKQLTQDLIHLVEPYIDAPIKSYGLTVARKVLVALRFFATGSYQLDIGQNASHCVSQASVSKCVREITDVLNNPDIFNEYIKLPRNFNELRECRNKFYTQKGFPGVVGCVDCTHIAIYPPCIQNEVHYVNRKGYHSINVQLVCDSDLKITNVCARYPGSSHDSFIWNNSNALNYIQSLYENGNTSVYFLGDSGYALRPWLLTPIANALQGSPEDRYNISHRSTRSLIEQCNGVLKLRFRCLLKHRVLHYSPERCCKIINSCCILHNMCIANAVPIVQVVDDIDLDFGMYDLPRPIEHNNVRHRVNEDLAKGRQLQQHVIRHHFA